MESEEEEEEEEYEEEDPFLNMDMDSPSFQCIKHVKMSSSSLLQQPYYFFPELEDPGINETLNRLDPAPIIDDIGVDRYQRLCKLQHIVPLSRIVKNLDKSVLDLRFYGLTYKQSRSLMDALTNNGHVTELILEGNWLDPSIVKMIAGVLRSNKTLKILNLKECRIGPKGAEYLAAGIAGSDVLEELDLSFNSLEDEGLSHLIEPLADNFTIKKLNLSHNDLTSEGSGEILGHVAISNDYIEDLNLGWNKFNDAAGNKKFCAGLKKNAGIVRFNLSWNGISTEPAYRAFAPYFRNPTLKYLDLSWNRLRGRCIERLRNTISLNKYLLELNLAGNPLTPEQADDLASVIAYKNKKIFKKVDMSCIAFTKAVKPYLERMQTFGKELIIGDIIGNYEIMGPNITKVYFDRCRVLTQQPKKMKAKKDFGHVILTCPDRRKGNIVAFEDAIKKIKAKKLDQELRSGLCSLYANKKRQINYIKMKAEYMDLYPDTKLPEKKKRGRRKKRKKGGATESGEESQAETEGVSGATSEERLVPEGGAEGEVVAIAGTSGETSAESDVGGETPRIEGEVIAEGASEASPTSDTVAVSEGQTTDKSGEESAGQSRRKSVTFEEGVQQ